jgi:hypothetical protein
VQTDVRGVSDLLEGDVTLLARLAKLLTDGCAH